MDKMLTLSEILQQSARKYPETVALVFQEKSWTYAQLWQKSLELASGLKNAGIKEQDKVVLFHKNSADYVLSIFALSHLGACAVPVNFYQKSEEVAYICLNSAAVALITQNVFSETAEFVKNHCHGINNVWTTDGASYQNLFISAPQISFASQPEQTILILYTSGTTGNPKGVMLSHHNLISNAEAATSALGIKHKDNFLCLLPMFHVFAWTANVLLPLALGCKIVVVESIRPPRPWIKLLSKHNITIFAAVPQIYALLAAQATGLKKWILRFIYFRTVRMGISGAAPLSNETMELFEQRFNIPLLEGYGLTETSPVTHVNTLNARRKNSVGRPLPGVQHKIIDENETVLPENTEGEICVDGDNVMQGYYAMPKETAEAFTKDGWFKTGDIGLIDRDNFLFIKDRIKDMIIINGLKVFSVQVEQVILMNPDVSEVAVVGIPDGSGNEIIKAFVVAKEGSALDKPTLQKLCQEKLPPYKRPKDFIFLKELPKNAMQKILKRQLRDNPS